MTYTSGHCRLPMDGRGQVFDLHAGCHGWARIENGGRVICGCPCHAGWNQPYPQGDRS